MVERDVVVLGGKPRIKGQVVVADRLVLLIGGDELGNADDDRQVIARGKSLRTHNTLSGYLAVGYGHIFGVYAEVSLFYRPSHARVLVGNGVVAVGESGYLRGIASRFSCLVALKRRLDLVAADNSRYLGSQLLLCAVIGEAELCPPEHAHRLWLDGQRPRRHSNVIIHEIRELRDYLISADGTVLHAVGFISKYVHKRRLITGSQPLIGDFNLRRRRLAIGQLNVRGCDLERLLLDRQLCLVHGIGIVGGRGEHTAELVFSRIPAVLVGGHSVDLRREERLVSLT